MSKFRNCFEHCWGGYDSYLSCSLVSHLLIMIFIFDYKILIIYIDWFDYTFQILGVDKIVNFDQNLGNLIENWLRTFKMLDNVEYSFSVNLSEDILFDTFTHHNVVFCALLFSFTELTFPDGVWIIRLSGSRVYDVRPHSKPDFSFLLRQINISFLLSNNYFVLCILSITIQIFELCI